MDGETPSIAISSFASSFSETPGLGISSQPKSLELSAALTELHRTVVRRAGAPDLTDEECHLVTELAGNETSACCSFLF